jgi:hypothetical protein
MSECKPDVIIHAWVPPLLVFEASAEPNRVPCWTIVLHNDIPSSEGK